MKRANIAVIMAAGKGLRAGSPVPKQYMDLKGKMVLERAVETFDNHPGIDQVAIVVDPGEKNRVKEIVAGNSWKKVTRILEGGKQRFQSSQAAIKAFADRSEDNMILHDAARPLVSGRIIDDVLEALKHYKAVGFAVPLTDTLFFTGPGNDLIIRVPDRNFFQKAQTPQGFRIPLLVKAYKYASDDPGFSATDDCGVVKRYLPKEKIFLVPGDEQNMKITYPGDLEILARWID
ncbi:MAG: 2-C-methyl-D-erythritol 4-phosphate cytidylyltransferase [Bacteroidales bacterium]